MQRSCDAVLGRQHEVLPREQRAQVLQRVLVGLALRVDVEEGKEEQVGEAEAEVEAVEVAVWWWRRRWRWRGGRRACGSSAHAMFCSSPLTSSRLASLNLRSSSETTWMCSE